MTTADGGFYRRKSPYSPRSHDMVHAIPVERALVAVVALALSSPGNSTT
ncbi:hypothetical protein [Amycolatopsis sp. NBC_01286]|nr:hypothetical protein OG570_37145 [Amycolatopsis sp. NBC_01286]